MKKLLLIIATALFLTSCAGQHFTTAYAIKTTESTYYCTNPKFDEQEQCIRGAELKRDGVTIRQIFEIPFDSVVWVNYNDKKYEWR